MNRLVVVALAAAAAVGAGCGAKDEAIGPGIPLGSNDGGGGGLPDGGSSPQNPAGNAGQVQIEILAPAAMAVLDIATAPEIRARIKSQSRAGGVSGDPILPDSIRYFLTTPDDPKGPATSGVLSGPTFDAEYAGRIDLSAMPSGPYDLAVTAATRAGAQGVARVQVQVDAGPKITILSPRARGAYKGSVAIEVLIDAWPFENGTAPEAFVGNAAVALTAGDGPGRYHGLLDLGGFEPPLIDEQLLRVIARNQRGTRSEAAAIFFVDEDGPLISQTAPGPGQVIGGVIRISAQVTDRASVLGPSVVAFIGNDTRQGFEIELQPDAPGSGVFSALFDTRKLTACRPAPDTGLCLVWPNLSFRAADVLGNETVLAYDLAVDNQPPIIDLDPPNLRVTRFDPLAGVWVCSHAFDPLGACHRLGDMPDDGTGVGQAFDLRARIEDQGNRATGLKLAPIAAVEPSSVVAYVLDDTSQALAVDIDDDGACDTVNPKLVPTTMPPAQSSEILAVRLVPLKPTGEADFTPDPSLAGGTCPVGTDLASPAPLCLAQELTISLGYSAASGPESAIWALEPIDGGWCAGSQFDAHANRIADGWACLAVVATDKVGNSSVSHPLRVYIDRSASSLQNRAGLCPLPPASAGPPPDCTGRYNPKSGELLTGSCSGRRFAPEIRPR
jgi:hypothetical protein